MLRPVSPHPNARRGVRHAALAATLMAGALLAAGCDRQPKPDTSAMNDPALTGASSVAPGARTDQPAVVADAGTAAGSGITPSDTRTGDIYGSSGTNDLPPTSAGKPATAALDAADKLFIEKASADGLFEVEAGKLAARQGKSEAVKAYGAMLSSDHASAGSQLKNLAASKGVAVSDALPAEKQTALDTLGRASSDFDHEFVRTVGIRAHQDAVALFEKASKEAKDPDVKSFATQTLPTLKAHLEAARKLPAGKS